jgi:hypothetical protein
VNAIKSCLWQTRVRGHESRVASRILNYIAAGYGAKVGMTACLREEPEPSNCSRGDNQAALANSEPDSCDLMTNKAPSYDPVSRRLHHGALRGSGHRNEEGVGCG